MLWEITAACEQSLDVYEGFPRLYVKRVVNVVTSDGKRVQAMIYVMAERYEGCPAEPSSMYLRTIWRGYLDNEIALKALQAAVDENVRELAESEDEESDWWRWRKK